MLNRRRRSGPAHARNRLQLRSIAGALAVVVALVACSSSSDDPDDDAATAAAGQPVAGGDLTVGWSYDMAGFDKDGTFDAHSIWTNKLIFETLTEASPEGELVPRLATEWEASDDGLSWTFTLREGVTFTNGQPFTSADVKFTYDELLDPKNPSNYVVTPLDSVEAPDPQTVVFNTKSPWPQLPESMPYVANGIVPVDYAGIERKDFYKQPIGTGPFVFAERTPGLTTTLTANENYWQEGKPYLDSVTFQVVEDDNARTLQLASGDLDVIEASTGAMTTAIESAPGATLGVYDSMLVSLLLMNANSDGPLGDPKVRQAIQVAIDRQAIVDSVLGGYGTPAASFLPDDLPYWDPTVEEDVTYDPDRAKELLADAGVDGGFDVEILLGAGEQQDTEVAAVMQQQLSAVGIDVRIETLDANAAYEQYLAGDFDLYQSSYSADHFDPGPFASWVVAGGNGWAIDQASMDGLTQLTDQARASFDEAEQADLFGQVQHEVASLVPQTSLWSSPYVYGSGERVHGFVVTPTGVLVLEDTWVDQG